MAKKSTSKKTTAPETSPAVNTPDITKKTNTAPMSARITCTAASRLNLTIPSIENAAAPTDSAALANVQVSSTPSTATLKASTGSAVVKVTIDSVTVKVPTESATVQASVSTPLANITASSKKRKNAEKVKVTTETLPSTTTPAKKHKRAEKTKMKTKALDRPQLCLLPSPQAMRTLSRRQKKDMGFDSEQGDGSGDEIDRDAKKDELEDNENKENEDQPNNNDENKDEARQEGRRENKAYFLKHGIGHVSALVEAQKALMVVVASDVQPPESVAWLPNLCCRKKVPFLIICEKMRLGSLVHKKASPVVALTAVRPEHNVQFARALEIARESLGEQMEREKEAKRALGNNQINRDELMSKELMIVKYNAALRKF